MTQAIVFIVIAVAVAVLVGVIAALLGRRSGRRAISQRLASLGTRLGLDPPEDEYNVETSLAYLEQVTGGAAQAVTESSSDAIRLRRSLDTLTQGVVLCDENGTVIYRNGRANALMVSRHGDALAAQAVTDVLEDAWHEGSAERTLDLYGPPRRTLQVRARQIDDGRRPLGVIALIEDISERRRLEEIRRDFVANVSHELKTPMGALGLLAETLVAEPDPDVAQRLAGRIHNEAFRVSRIIDDLLDLSRIESEEAPPREPVLVNLVMADAIERVRATADQRGIEIVLHEPSPPVAVLGDRRQLVSAMHALLENAITYSYDNSKVVVTGAVQRFNPNLSHPSIAGNLVDEGDDVLGHDPITGEYPAVVAEAGMMPGAGDTDAGKTDAGNTDAGQHGRREHRRREHGRRAHSRQAQSPRGHTPQGRGRWGRGRWQRGRRRHGGDRDDDQHQSPDGRDGGPGLHPRDPRPVRPAGPGRPRGVGRHRHHRPLHARASGGDRRGRRRRNRSGGLQRGHPPQLAH